jgi:hypothetical protein
MKNAVLLKASRKASTVRQDPLNIQFGEVPEAIQEKVQQITDPDALDRLFRLAYKANSLEELNL